MAESPLQNASGPGIAQALGKGATATVTVNSYQINIHMSPDQIEKLVKNPSGLAEQAVIDALHTELNTTRQAVMGFLTILREDHVPPERLKMKLEEIARRHKGLIARLGALDPKDDVARGLIEQAREVVRSAASMADYDRADEFLFEAEEAYDPALRGAEKLELEAHEAARRLRLSKASTRAERAELSLTRLDYLKAAEHFRAAAVIGTEDLSVAAEYLFLSAGALQSFGDEKGDSAVLAKAIIVYREVLNACPRERVPMNWAATQNNLGNALSKLGERESGTERLESRFWHIVLRWKNTPASVFLWIGQLPKTIWEMRSRRWASGRTGRSVLRRR